MSDVGAFVALVVGAIVVVVVLILGGAYAVDRSRCGSLNHTSGYETDFRRTTMVTWDCYANIGGGKWIPYSQVRTSD